MASDRHRLAIEQHLGSQEGEAFGRRLREAERAEREDRLSRIVLGAYGLGETVPGIIPAVVAEPDRRVPAALEVLQLERKVEQLTDFYDAVQNSRAWRLMQSLRRLAG